MQKLSEQAMIDAISSASLFEAELEDGSIYIRVNEYVPYVCTAIHAGHRLRSDLDQQCCLTGQERLSEEDPYTDQMIDPFPVTLVARDSRYEYDLNRSRQDCIYRKAWGKDVWSTPLSCEQKEQARKKHSTYYRILQNLLRQLEQKFGGCLLIDVHSYNWKIREYEYAPVFNIGTAGVEIKRWQRNLRALEKGLKAVSLPHITTDCSRNIVFKGRGYQAKFIRENFKNTLVVPLEIKKVYIDEHSGDVYPLVLDRLKAGLYLAVLDAAAVFNDKLRCSKLKMADLLPADIEPVVLKVDKALFKLARGIETLNCVNPVNIQQEKKRFYSQKGYEPHLRYRQLNIDPYEFKERLYQLPVSEIQEPLIRGLFREVIECYATKVDLLSHVGTPQFLYNSLRYYGRPSSLDIENAKFLLHAGAIMNEEKESSTIPAQNALEYFSEAARHYDLDCQIVLSARIVAKAMVDNSRRVLYINRNAGFTLLEINALVHHELGVHMATTMNARQQPLHILKLGLPGNTYTQEGLAILSEYLSGYINLERLQQLSLRVLAVDMMVRGFSFSQVFRCLQEDYGVPGDDAFGLALRVFRGGGFTKDYLYLCGFRDMVAMLKTRDITNLLVGKTGADYIETLDMLVERGLLKKPRLIAQPFMQPAEKRCSILDYLVSAIR